MDNYSVLLPVYCKEKASNFIQSISSILCQTVLTNDFVIVCDGPLTEELDGVIRKFTNDYPDIFNIVRLSKNSGLGIALNEGLKACKNEIVMRMDSDDISLPTRAEEELVLMDKYELVGSWISDFDKTSDFLGIRKVCENYEDIKKQSVYRSPFCHPSVMFRKSTIEKAGGYMHLPYVEDWYLWIRILMQTKNVYNIQKVLVKMRSGAEQVERRGNHEFYLSVKILLSYMRDNKYISKPKKWTVHFIYKIFICSGNWFRRLLYKTFLRKHK